MKKIPTLEEMGFKDNLLGLVVKIHPGSGYYRRGTIIDPIDIPGKIVGFPTVDDQMCIVVHWDNHNQNGYRMRDLMLDFDQLKTQDEVDHLCMVYGIKTFLLKDHKDETKD